MSTLPRESLSVRALYLSCLVFVAASALMLINNQLYLTLEGELAPVESLNAFAFLAASIVLLWAGWKTTTTEKHKKWMLLGAGAVFFWVAGEEVSWGYHWFDLITPDWLIKINKQQETNLHNINKKFFDRMQERLVVILAFLSCAFHLRGKEKLLGFRLPDFALSLGFLLLPFYRRFDSVNVDLWTAGPIAFLAYLALATRKKDQNALLMCIAVLVTALISFYGLYFHADLLGDRNNVVHEIREMVFSFLCMVYAIQLQRDEQVKDVMSAKATWGIIAAITVISLVFGDNQTHYDKEGNKITQTAVSFSLINAAHAEEETVRDRVVRDARRVEKDVANELIKARESACRAVKGKDCVTPGEARPVEELKGKSSDAE